MKFADLHLHTVFSDSTYTPKQLVSEALTCGLTAIAVADHDSIEGIEPTLEMSKGRNLEVLPAIELSAEYKGLEIHILGYLIDYQKKQLSEKLNFLRQNRIERIHKIISKLNALGVRLNASSVFEIAGGGTPGRLHVARALLKENWVGSILEAFKMYIGENAPAYVLGFRFTPTEAINLIRNIGGISVLAHPYSLKHDELIPYFVDQGLMGLEVYYPEHTQTMVNNYLTITKKYNLLVTGGSDCHGNAKPEVKIGSLKVPYKLVEELKKAKQKL